ncbi:MAG: hypothetical protein VYC34_05210, partial [Planctomycetota bacterium]|nr:hypothetical protein [Planctomycetota bacterium]
MRMNQNRVRATGALALAAGAAMTCATAMAGGEGRIGVIYSEIATDPSSTVPGVQFGEVLTALLDLHSSPDGAHWIFKGFTDAASAANDIIVVGSGSMGEVKAQEGQPSPLPA